MASLWGEGEAEGLGRPPGVPTPAYTVFLPPTHLSYPQHIYLTPNTHFLPPAKRELTRLVSPLRNLRFVANAELAFSVFDQSSSSELSSDA